ncbi:MAG: type II secretion system F family protein [Anaerolineae bacterium]
MTLALVVGMAAALSVVLMFVGVMRFIEAQANPEQRLAVELARRQRFVREEEAKKGAFFIINRLDRAIASRGFSDGIARNLLQADLRITVSEYILIRAAVVFVAFLLGVPLIGNAGAGVILAVAGFFLPPLYVRYRRHKRQKDFENQLDDVLVLLAGALRAGYSLLHALNVVVDEIPSPASDEFRRVVNEVGLGLSLQEALQNLVRRLESDDLDMIVTAINIQQDVGGNLANILDVVTETIRERIRIQGEIRTLTTQGRITGYILSFLPFILGGIIYIINPEYVLGLFAPGMVRIMPIVATVLILVGFLVIRKIVDIEV